MSEKKNYQKYVTSDTNAFSTTNTIRITYRKEYWPNGLTDRQKIECMIHWSYCFWKWSSKKLGRFDVKSPTLYWRKTFFFVEIIEWYFSFLRILTDLNKCKCWNRSDKNLGGSLVLYYRLKVFEIAISHIFISQFHTPLELLKK